MGQGRLSNCPRAYSANLRLEYHLAVQATLANNSAEGGSALFHAFSSLVLVVLAVSSGAVLGARRTTDRRGRAASPGFVDALIISSCWAGRLITSRQGIPNSHSLVIWIAIALCASYAVHRFQRQWYGQGVRERESLVSDTSQSLKTPEAGTRIRKRLRAWASDVGGFQTRLILAGLYYSLFMPFGLTVGLWGDPLKLRTKSPGTSWEPRPSDDATLKESGRQF